MTIVCQNLAEVLPGYMVYGEYENRKGILPQKEGRKWYEVDINYTQGYRNNERILYSNDGLIFATFDHYKTFIEVIGEENWNMREIVLDFTKCKNAKSEEMLYQIIKRAFNYPFCFGDNPDALWEAMKRYWRDNVHLKLYGVYDLEYRYLQMEMNYILEVFKDVHEDTPNVTFEIIS